MGVSYKTGSGCDNFENHNHMLELMQTILFYSMCFHRRSKQAAMLL